MILDDISQRVLGALMEKETLTPETYPLSLNALVAACNQRSSRDPVLQLDEDEVRSALDTLSDLDLVTSARDNRVPRFEHRIRTTLQLRRDETAVLCLLLLRGPQTPGELRARSERLFPFDDTAQTQSTLDRMAAREQPLVHALPRAAGSREVRWVHLLGAPPQPVEPRTEPRHPQETSLLSRIDQLERTVEALALRITTLEQLRDDPS